MELHQLRYFCAIVDSGSFSRAARQSHVSQPSLSQQIRKLEDELGARLFDRLGRSVRLTEIGQTFLPRARAVLRELEAARGDLAQQENSMRGTIAVGVIPTVAPDPLPPHLTKFSRKFPEAKISIVEEITPILLERLRAASIDLALLALPIRGHEFETFPILTEPLFAALPQKHSLARRRSLAEKTSAPNPSCSSATATASAKTRLPLATAPDSILRSSSKAASSAASSAWSPPAWAFPSSPKWPSTKNLPAPTSLSPTITPRAPSAPSASAAAFLPSTQRLPLPTPQPVTALRFIRVSVRSISVGRSPSRKDHRSNARKILEDLNANMPFWWSRWIRIYQG